MKGTALRRLRRAVQLAVLALAVAAPFADLARLDPPTRSLVFLRQHLYLSHFWVLLLFLLLLVYGFVALNLVLGRVFCGWLCPQTLIAEIAEGLAARLLGRRSPLSGPGDPARLRGLRRAAFHLAAAAASLAGAFVLSAYFVPPATLVATLRRLAPAADRPVWVLFLGVALGLFVNVVAVRHRLCAACPLGAAQAVLRGERALQVGLDPGRPEDCARCTACARACPMGLDPREPDPRHCLNCAECLVACNLVSARRGLACPLRWSFGPPAAAVPARAPAARLAFLGTVLLLLLGFFAYGLVTRDRLGLAVARPPRGHVLSGPAGARAFRYLVLVRNQGERPGTFRLEVAGLPDGWAARLSRSRLDLAPGQEARLTLDVTPPARAAPGPYAFRVRARERSDARWRAEADAVAFVPPRRAATRPEARRRWTILSP